MASSATRRSWEVIPRWRRRRRAPRRRARPRAASAARCSTRATRRPSPGGAARRCRSGSDRGPRSVSGRSIASRVVPGPGGDDHALGAEEPVDQRGLADVGPSDHSQPDRSSVLAVLGSASASERGDPVEQVAGSEPLRRGDGDRARRARARWNSAASGMSPTVSTLLAATSTGSGRAPQQVGHLLIAGAHPRLGVDDEHGDVGVGERRARLLLHWAATARRVPPGRRRRYRSASAGGRSSRCAALCGRG